MSLGALQYLPSLITASMTVSPLAGHWPCPTLDTDHWRHPLTSLVAAAADDMDDDVICRCSRRLFWNQIRTFDLSSRWSAAVTVLSWAVSSSSSLEDGVFSTTTITAQPSDAHCGHNTGTAIKHPVPDRVKPSFVIFDIRTLWRSALSVRVPGWQKLQMTA